MNDIKLCIKSIKYLNKTKELIILSIFYLVIAFSIFFIPDVSSDSSKQILLGPMYIILIPFFFEAYLLKIRASLFISSSPKISDFFTKSIPLFVEIFSYACMLLTFAISLISSLVIQIPLNRYNMAISIWYIIQIPIPMYIIINSVYILRGIIMMTIYIALNTLLITKILLIDDSVLYDFFNLPLTILIAVVSIVLSYCVNRLCTKHFYKKDQTQLITAKIFEEKKE